MISKLKSPRGCTRILVASASSMIAAAVISVSMASAARAQFATDAFTSDYSGVYVGGRVAYTNLSVAQKYDAGADKQDKFTYSSTPISVAATAGFQYNAYLGAEANVYFPVTYPRSTFTTTGTPKALTTAPSGFNTSGTTNIYTTTKDAPANYGIGYSVALVGSYPLSPEFLLYVKLGVGGATLGEEKVVFLDNDNTTNTEIQLNKGLTPVGFSFGGGLRFRVGRNFLLALEYEQTVLGGEGTIDASSVSMSNISLTAGLQF